MKQLTLIRHAKSSWKVVSLADIDRPLSKRGKRDAPEMASRLAKRSVRPDLVISSPAKRARKTAKVIAEALGYPWRDVALDERVYHAGPCELLKVLQGVEDACAHVMLFGHNPGLTELASQLTGRDIENVPTCGVVEAEFDIESWAELGIEAGALVEFDYPKRPAP